MKLEAVTGVTPPTILNSFDNYHVIPDTYTQIAKQTTATASPSDAGASVQTKYKVNISSSQTAGSYTGKVKYTMVHPNDAPAPTPISFDDAYAAAGKTKLNNYYKMQDMSSTICSAVTFVDDESETTLIDSRDNKTYTVSKLKDGNCWMTQNLRFDLDSTKIYTSQDTDIATNWTPSSSTYSSEIKDLDYSKLWGDDEYWLPPVLAGKEIEAYFHYNSDNTFDEYSVGTLKPELYKRITSCMTAVCEFQYSPSVNSHT